jgi:A/G-specific adenine glycosylase
MWELPHIELLEKDLSEVERMRTLQNKLAEDESIYSEPQGWFMDTEHIFSHIRWEMGVYQLKLESQSAAIHANLLPFHYRWIGPEDIADYAFPNVFLRIFKAYWK